MGVVLQASSRFGGNRAMRSEYHRPAVDVRNVQGSTHRVLNEILQYTFDSKNKTACGFLFLS